MGYIDDQIAKIASLGSISKTGPEGPQGTGLADSCLKFLVCGKSWGEGVPSGSRVDNIHPHHKGGLRVALYKVQLVYKYVDEETGAFQVPLAVKEPACQCRRHERPGFDPWVAKIPQRRK